MVIATSISMKKYENIETYKGHNNPSHFHHSELTNVNILVYFQYICLSGMCVCMYNAVEIMFCMESWILLYSLSFLSLILLFVI